jgi:hypothetical protein
MRAPDERLSTARATGNSGVDYLTTGTLTYATQWPTNDSKGWYAFVVGEEATVTSVTLVDRGGNTLTPEQTTTWLNVALPVGMYVPSGFVTGKDAYISAITLSSGTIALYLD